MILTEITKSKIEVSETKLFLLEIPGDLGRKKYRRKRNGGQIFLGRQN